MTTPAKIGRPRNSDEPEHVYLLKMPKAIWNAAAAKAKMAKPPLAMKWLIVKMLERWAGLEEPHIPLPRPEDIKPAVFPSEARRVAVRKKTGRKPRSVPAGVPLAQFKGKEIAEAVPPVVAPPTAPLALGVPDLGDAF